MMTQNEGPLQRRGLVVFGIQGLSLAIELRSLVSTYRGRGGERKRDECMRNKRTNAKMMVAWTYPLPR